MWLPGCRDFFHRTMCVGETLQFLAVLRFFVTMTATTTPVSDFYFRFEFIVLDFIRNDIHIDRIRGRLFEIYGVKVPKKIKNYLNELQQLFTRNFFIFCGNLVYYNLAKKLAKSVHDILVTITSLC